MEAHCIAQIAIAAKKHIRQIDCCFPRRRSFCLLPKQTNKPHRSAGVDLGRLGVRYPGIHAMERLKPKDLYCSTSSALCQDEDAFSKIREARPLGWPEGRTLTDTPRVPPQNSGKGGRREEMHAPPKEPQMPKGQRNHKKTK